MQNKDFDTCVEKIIESKSFGRSDTYANLLRYLVTCTLEHNIPKETTIASEIFGKSSFDPSQSTLIRVYIYNLRKKLKAYYANEGKADAIVLRIPKGSYEVSFDALRTNSTLIVKPKKRAITFIALIVTILALLPVSYFYLQDKESKPVVDYALWNDLFESDKNNMLILGDLFTYVEIDSVAGLKRNIRDPNLNSMSDFVAFKALDDRTHIEYESLTYAYLIQSSALWIKDLAELFYRSDNDFVIRTISRFNSKELSDNNFIVVGMIKTLGVFKDFLEKYECSFNVKTSTLTFTEGDVTTNVNYSPIGDADAYHTDYAIMAKIPGPNNNLIYLFGGIWDTGTSQSLKNFTDPILLKTLENTMLEKFGIVPKYYKILFEVNGLDRTELSSKVLFIEAL